MCICRWCVLLAMMLGVAGAAIAQQGNPRIALVIGNDSYQKVSALRNARADARAMAQSLERAGFRVTLRVDANERAMKEAIRTFKAQLSGGAEAVFFFAGHGVQLGGANYLLPTDIGSESEDQVKDDALSLQRVLNDMQEQKARFSMAIIDACRNNPFRSAGRAIGGRGLAPTTAASGQIVLYSAGTGQEALDRLGNNDTNPNGLFTRVFLREMEKPGVPVDQVLRNVREQVVKLAKGVGHDQVPALYDQAIGRFYFHASTGATQTAALNPEPRQTTDPLQVEMMFWDSIKGSTAREDFEEYKSRFPNGQFVGLADNRIRALTPPAKPGELPACPGSYNAVTWTSCLGARTFSNGDKYVGEYKDGKPNGQGTYTFADGRKYVGEYKDGMRNGQGTYTSPKGDKYVGEYKDGKRNGQGTYTFASGNKYVGEFKDDKPNGQGTFTFANGNKHVGEYKDGKPNGQGTYTFTNGDKYVGEYKDGMRNGQGTYTSPKGDKYVGEYKDGKRNGQGTFFYADGTVYYSGLWEDDKRADGK